MQEDQDSDGGSDSEPSVDNMEESELKAIFSAVIPQTSPTKKQKDPSSGQKTKNIKPSRKNTTKDVAPFKKRLLEKSVLREDKNAEEPKRELNARSFKLDQEEMKET